MLCRNCNYILSGKENFCPNCGSVSYKTVPSYPEIKRTAEEKSGSENEKEATVSKVRPMPDKELFYADKSHIVNEPITDEELFPNDDSPEEEQPVRKTGQAGKIFLLVFISCTLAVAAFGLADYFGITPAFANFVSTISQKQPSSQTEAHSFSHEDTVVEPEVSYPMTTAYVLSGKGLTLRKGPGNGYAPIASLTDFTKVQIFGGSLANSQWLYVYCLEQEGYGWLDGSYLCKEQIAEAKLTTEYESYEDIPTNYYREEY